jgi:hypothetical protein
MIDHCLTWSLLFHAKNPPSIETKAATSGQADMPNLDFERLLVVGTVKSNQADSAAAFVALQEDPF